MIDLNFKYSNIISEIRNQKPFDPEICIVLGSGLGDFADKVETIKSIKTSSLPGYPLSTVQGHEGYLHFSKYCGKKLLILQGRIHFYEGYTLSQCVLPVHLAVKTGCSKLVLTNAAGGMNPQFKPGSLMLASGFNGSIIKKELTDLLGITTLEQKNLMLNLPSRQMNKTISQAALEEKIHLHEGIYWMTKGPSYETVSEINMYRKFGGEAVGMSTVPEAFYAANQGLEVASVSCITNYASGLSDQALSHNEVMETANRVKHDFERLIKKSIEML